MKKILISIIALAALEAGGATPVKVAPGQAVATRLERNRHGDSSGVRGAAWLWRT